MGHAKIQPPPPPSCLRKIAKSFISEHIKGTVIKVFVAWQFQHACYVRNFFSEGPHIVVKDRILTILQLTVPQRAKSRRSV